ncbi:multicopper oxidase family protein [Caballeronia sordidicola]|uniref:Multicopper oxidase n=1 Tax=Caballeronia sordidicola TaxID=196367 RepID=A0A242M8K8_CABSO|nr:multicopper oxidase family protein [Caballeronia sordidicola]OTP67430.1 Multicopper oxidase [Caballeronia sordidicola]
MLSTRRQFLITSVAAASAFAGCTLWQDERAKSADTADGGQRRRLIAERRVIEVNGRSASMLGLRQQDGTRGIFLDPDERFIVDLDNQMSDTTIIHWHGQTPPSAMDGVSDLGISPIQPAEQRPYEFVARPGTHWMHSHQALQHQQLLAGPLIVRTADDRREDRQEITIFLEDFLFADPMEVLESLQRGEDDSDMPAKQVAATTSSSKQMASMMADRGMARMGAANSMAGMQTAAAMPAMKMDLNDVDFDAYLANERTLEDPEVIHVEKGGKVRLRVINGASSTNFHLELGTLNGTVTAVDGDAVLPLTGSRFGLAMAQRIDILVDLPDSPGAWPVLALREGEAQQTGVILATSGAAVPKLSSRAASAAGPVTFELENRLSAAVPLLTRPVDKQFMLMLGGSMHPYAWTINGRDWENRDPLQVRKGQRVSLTFHNLTMMSHPMHLHGHHFQVVAINGAKFSGAMRDTVHVPPTSKVVVEFDADNEGRWLLHCHNLYHMQTGMMTEVTYV